MIFLYLFLTILSIYSLIKGAELLMQGAVSIAEKFHISQLVIASTLIAFGTGLPTIAVNIAMILISDNGSNIAVGNAIGTNFVNIGLGLGIPAFLTLIRTKYDVFEKEIPIYLALVGLLTSFVLDGSINRLEGLILLFAYLITLFIVYQYAQRSLFTKTLTKEFELDTSTLETTPTENISTRKSVFLIFIGLIILILFSIILSYIAPELAYHLNISSYIIGLTVIGIGTSLPTIITSIRAAKKGYIDIILGNVFGGTIANIALGLGLPSIIKDLSLSNDVLTDIYDFNILNMFMILGILIEMKLLKKENRTLNKVSGIVIITVYLVYLLNKFVQ